MGNRIVLIKDLAKIEKDTFFNNYFRILLKNGNSYSAFIDDYPLLRLENYLHMPYSKIVTDKTKAQISQDNKNGVPIELHEITFVFNDPNASSNPSQPRKLAASVRNVYIKDLVAYHKLLVHRGAFESLITKVLENKEEIYTPEFQTRFNDERDKFLELLKKKTGAFTSKL
jgi:hypothetical protein